MQFNNLTITKAAILRITFGVQKGLTIDLFVEFQCAENMTAFSYRRKNMRVMHLRSTELIYGTEQFLRS